MQAHPWFVDVDWKKLYDMEAAVKPEVDGELDTRNFMKFDELDPPTPSKSGSGSSRKMHLTPKDFSFVGYTYKNFDAIKEVLRNKSDTADETIPMSVGNELKEMTEEPDIRMYSLIDDVMSP